MTPDPTILVEEVSRTPFGEPSTQTFIDRAGQERTYTSKPYTAEHRELFLRLPTRLVPMPGTRLDLLELEDWIVAGFCIAYQKVHSTPPPLEHAAAISGRSTKRVKASWERMAKRGWIGMQKVPHRYGEKAKGEFGYKWRIWYPQGSPLREAMDAAPGSGFRFIAVPQQVARYRSVLLTALYLIAHEQRRIDGAIVTTCTDLAGMLSCDRNTIRRLLRVLNVHEVEKPRPGVALYDMELLFDRPDAGTVLIGDVDVTVRGNRERQLQGVHALQATLVSFGRGEELTRTAGELHERFGEVRLDLLVRVVEERNRRFLTKDHRYGTRLALRLGSRLRRMVSSRARAASDVAVDVERQTRSIEGNLIRDALARVCSTCDGDRVVLVRENGGDTALPCPSCSPSG